MSLFTDFWLLSDCLHENKDNLFKKCNIFFPFSFFCSFCLFVTEFPYSKVTYQILASQINAIGDIFFLAH